MIDRIQHAMALLEQRFGRMQVRFWIVLVLFAVSCISMLLIYVNLVLAPALAGLSYSASFQALLTKIQPQLIGFTLLCVLAAGMLIRIGLIRPTLERRTKLETDLAAAPTRDEVQSLAHKRSRLESQLDAVLDDNQALRDQIQTVLQDKVVAQDHLRALIQSSEEAVILFNAEGLGVIASSPMSVILQVRSEDVAGTPAERLLQIYDASKENPREYPLPPIVAETLKSASTLPKLFQVVLVDQSGIEHSLMLSTQAILDSQSRVQGVVIHANNLDLKDAPTRGAQPHVQGSSVTGISGREAFANRAGELLRMSKTQGSQHSLLLFKLDDLNSVYERFGYSAVEELLWVVSQTARECFGTAVEMFQASMMHYAILLPFTAADDAASDAESLRSAVDAREFHWHNDSFRASLTIVVSEINSETESIAVLLNESDQTWRDARSLGGNRVQIYAADALNKQTREIDKQLIAWLEVDGENSHLQMQSWELAAVSDGELPYWMVQLRVEMDDGVWADAAAFVSAAERINALGQLDRWLCQRSIQAMAAQGDNLQQAAGVILPIHTQTLEDSGFIDFLQDLLLDNLVSAEKITICLDEISCNRRLSQILPFIESIRVKGFHFAISGCRPGSLPHPIVDLKPELIGIHPSVIQSRAHPKLLASSIAYLSSAGEELRFKLAMLDPKHASDEFKSTNSGLDYCAIAPQGIGPLY